MKKNCNLGWRVLLTLVLIGQSAWVCAASIPVTGWVVHNGTSTVSNGGTNSPTFAGADNITVMGTFAPVELLNTGDSVKVSTTLTMDTRTANTGTNSLNTQLRIGLFDGPGAADPVVANDILTPATLLNTPTTRQPKPIGDLSAGNHHLHKPTRSRVRITSAMAAPMQETTRYKAPTLVLCFLS
jgi:hypothetical protein